MKKIEFLKRMVQWCWGPEFSVKAGDCGQRYWITRLGDPVREVWVDNLPGGRASIKIKFSNTLLGRTIAQSISDAMWNFLMSNEFVVDAAAKADWYEGFEYASLVTQEGRGDKTKVAVARLRCDKYWN